MVCVNNTYWNSRKIHIWTNRFNQGCQGFKTKTLPIATILGRYTNSVKVDQFRGKTTDLATLWLFGECGCVLLWRLKKMREMWFLLCLSAKSSSFCKNRRSEKREPMIGIVQMQRKRTVHSKRCLRYVSMNMD